MPSEEIRILIVEDDPVFARLVETTLAVSRRARFATQSVPRLDAAIALLKRDPFDVVLLDLDLPDSQGMDTVRQAIAATPHIPIVVMTGHDDEQTALDAMRHGAEDYLMKGPVNEEALVRAVRYALRRHRNVVDLRHFAQELMTNVDRFMSIVESARIGAVVTSPDGQVLYHNNAAVQILGRDAGTLRADPFDIPGEVGQATLLDPRTLESPRGPGRKIEVQIAETEWDDRPARLHLIYPQDDTDPQEPRSPSGLAAALYAHSEEMVAVLDTDGTIREVSPASDLLLGLAPEALVGTTVWERLHAEDEADFRDAFLDAVENGTEHSSRHTALRADGGPVLVETRLYPTTDPVIHITDHVLCITRAVDPAEADAGPALARLQAHADNKTRLLGSVAEAFDTHLGPLSTHLHMLVSEELGALNDAQRASLGVLDRQTGLLGALVQDLIDLVRSQTGHLRLDTHETDLGRIATDTVASYRAFADERDLTLTVDASPTTISGDPRRLGEAFAHLIAHAIEETPAGGSVAIAVGEEADGPTFSVQDSAPGHDMEAADHLFEPFAGGGRHGTGLGLFLADQIVQAHGGRLRAYQPPAGGNLYRATFRPVKTARSR
ncbi:MAG: response regulator [Euryarchaeota archaeon]|nr:response regulator [Euryarchaeota archaeon]